MMDGARKPQRFLDWASQELMRNGHPCPWYMMESGTAIELGKALDAWAGAGCCLLSDFIMQCMLVPHLCLSVSICLGSCLPCFKRFGHSTIVCQRQIVSLTDIVAEHARH